MTGEIGQDIAMFALGWMACSHLRRAFRRWRWRKEITADIERKGLRVTSIEWMDDVPIEVHITRAPGAHDAG